MSATATRFQGQASTATVVCPAAGFYEAVVASPNWERTVLVINYDEWGGFFDHVPPSTAPDAHPES